MTAAPLKLFDVHGGFVGTPAFPRSDDRGPIEAVLLAVTAPEARDFPRSDDRGPIEAAVALRESAMNRLLSAVR